MRFQQELQQMLQVQSLPSLSHGALAYLEACLQASLLDLIARLKYLLRRYSSYSGAMTSALPYGSLVLLLHLHNQPRFYRLASFLGLEEARKKAKESASGASELDMLNENDDAANDGGEHFDDAWLGGGSGSGAASTSAGSTAASTSTLDLSPATLPQAFLATSVLSTYGDDFVGMSSNATSTDGPEAILHRKLPPGFLEHIRRVQATDAITVNMSPSEYIQYSESRAQAGFTHHKIRSKRFRDFVTPLLTLHDIPITDELLDILGFLAHEIVFDHIEQGKDVARKRITAQRRLELRARKAALRDSPQSKSTKEKGGLTSRSGKKSGVKGSNSTNGKKSTKLGPKEKKAKAEEDKKKEIERLEQLKIEEQNRHPDGPFSAPAGSNMTHGMPVPIHCPADIDGPLDIPDDPAVEHSKTDNTTTHASIASAYDVLLGDFEEAFHASHRDGWDRVAPARRRRRFVDLFR